MKNDPEKKAPKAKASVEDPKEHLSPDMRFIGGLVAKIQDTPAPESLLAGVMARVKPKTPSVGRRLWHFLTRPKVIRIIPIRLVPAGAALLAILIAWFGMESPWLSRPRDPFESQTSTSRENHRFTLHMDKASSVAVIGDFNNWNPQGFELHWDENCHCYSLFLPLPPGRYQYAFLVDGRILADPQAVLSQDDGFGHKNSIIIINHDHTHEKKI